MATRRKGITKQPSKGRLAYLVAREVEKYLVRFRFCPSVVMQGLTTIFSSFRWNTLSGEPPFPTHWTRSSCSGSTSYLRARCNLGFVYASRGRHAPPTLPLRQHANGHKYSPALIDDQSPPIPSFVSLRLSGRYLFTSGYCVVVHRVLFVFPLMTPVVCTTIWPLTFYVVPLKNGAVLPLMMPSTWHAGWIASAAATLPIPSAVLRGPSLRSRSAARANAERRSGRSTRPVIRSVRFALGNRSPRSRPGDERLLVMSSQCVARSE